MVIKELVLHSNDLIGSKEFYTKILELTVLEKTGTAISFASGHTILTFVLSQESNPCYHFAFRIPSNKVDDAHAFISKKTNILPFTPGTTIADFSNWNAHAFYFHDNQNNIVEFIAHHNLPGSSEETFTSSSIIGVCEIGIPVDGVTGACKNLNEQYKVPYYVKGPRLSDFAVMGDEYGLFIVTKIGRGWLPTQKPAGRHFTEVVFENDGDVKKLLIK